MMLNMILITVRPDEDLYYQTQTAVPLGHA